MSLKYTRIALNGSWFWEIPLPRASSKKNLKISQGSNVPLIPNFTLSCKIIFQFLLKIPIIECQRIGQLFWMDRWGWGWHIIHEYFFLVKMCFHLNILNCISRLECVLNVTTLLTIKITIKAILFRFWWRSTWTACIHIKERKFTNWIVRGKNWTCFIS